MSTDLILNLKTGQAKFLRVFWHVRSHADRLEDKNLVSGSLVSKPFNLLLRAHHIVDHLTNAMFKRL